MGNTLHFYPINGHSNVRISILVCGISYDCGNIKSPDKSFLKVDINKLYVENNLKSQTYQVIAKSRNRIATRMNFVNCTNERLRFKWRIISSLLGNFGHAQYQNQLSQDL